MKWDAIICAPSVPFVAQRPFNMTLTILPGNRVKIDVDNTHLYTYTGDEDLLHFYRIWITEDVEMNSVDTWCLP